MAAFSIILTFNHEINTSLQIGDQVYHTTASPVGGFQQNPNISDQIHIGHVTDIISPFEIVVYSEYTDSNGDPLAWVIPSPGLHGSPGDYISFSKNRIVNNNNLLGYYGYVRLLNDSTKKAELFSIGSVVTENSK